MRDIPAAHRLSIPITDASQFKLITELLPAVFLYESESLHDRTYGERRALLGTNLSNLTMHLPKAHWRSAV